jgi:ubiquinone/menaquinone biosynthesis C-methylase UbiE
MTPFNEWFDLYDWVYAWKRDDIPFYVEQARKSDGPVLELGCGTGRIAIPIAKAGVEVVGLDSSAKMLQVARRKAKASGSISGKLTWLLGDMRSLSMSGKFALVIIPYRGFLSLLNVEEQRRCLDGIRAHLLPGGKLIFDIFVPDLDTMTEGSTAAVHSWDVSHPERGNRLVVWDQSRFDNHNQVIDVRMIIEELDGTGQVLRKLYRDFQLRYIHRFEAQHLLELCGFHVIDLFGDFDGESLYEDSTDMIWVASPRT